MELQPGATLSSYRIVDKLGEGGMGVVWKAVDTHLDREVAVKVLPPMLTADPERLARFEREAKLLASLNHAHIAQVHGLHEHDGQRFIVMELVAGDDLSERLKQGPLPLEETLALAAQIATGLEVAHEQGVIHRDLKPANVKLTANGDAKILDFGLAKAFEPDPTASGASATMSPTLTSAGSIVGVILGTAAYMSPQQARGHVVDKRADVWSFGCLLFEMLSGKLAFPGETVSDTLAAVLKLEPDWSALPADLPRPLVRLLRRCLEKDARSRLRDIGEARIALEAIRSGAGEEAEVAEAAAPGSGSRLPWLVAATATVLALVGWGLFAMRPDGGAAAKPMRFGTDLVEALAMDEAGAPFAWSPDGERFVYVGGDPPQLHVRRLGEFEATPLSGTEGARQPFFSPDGQWIGFFTGNDLRKVPVLGGASMKLAAVRSTRGGSWGEDGYIVVAPHTTEGLVRIPEVGGEPEVLTDPDADGVRSHRWPQVLSGGRAVLYTSQPPGKSFDESTLMIVDVATRESTVVLEGGSFGRYVPSGHVVYVHERTLFAVPFDLSSRRTTGAPYPVLEQVSYDLRNGGAELAFSPQGHLAYVSGEPTARRRNVVAISPDGTEELLWSTPGEFRGPRLSPDGNRLLLFASATGGSGDVWIHDLRRGAATRLTFFEGADFFAIWSPAGDRVAFSSLRDSNVPNIHWRAADGSDEVERLTESHDAQFPDCFSPDGKVLLYRSEGSRGWDLWALDLETRESTVFLQTDFAESQATFSPDGRWVAYDSDESGTWEVYVRPYPPGPGKWQISAGGGGYAVWALDGKGVYFSTGDGDLMYAGVVASGNSLRVDAPRRVLEGKVPSSGIWRDYDLMPDGRVIALPPVGEEAAEPPRARVILNWFDELRGTGGG